MRGGVEQLVRSEKQGEGGDAREGKAMEIHFENVTDKNIQTIAEGHLDLSRKLDDALKVENEKELLVVRVRIIEDELRKMKEQPNQIA